jgi:lambda family phage portal protein
VKTIENSKNTNSKYRAPTGRVIRVVNKGYGDAGASWKKKSLKGFTAESGSPSEDIDQHNSTLRQRARMLYMAAPIATSAIRTNRTNVIGCGLKLKSRINRQILGLTQEQADAWEKKVEAEFELWASRKQACDATGVNDFYALQQLTLMSWLMSGDAFVIIKRYPETPLYPYSLRLHVIEADRVSTPTNLLQPVYNTTEGKAENGNRIFDGVEIDENGAIVAYYISNRYPNSIINPADIKWTRVEAYGKLTGLPNILQIMDSERPEQYRGVSYLAQVIEPLLQMRRYTESELMAALVESFFTAFIKTESNPNDMPFNEVAPQDQVSRDPNEYEMGPGVINIMNPGEDVTFADPKRPSNGFDAFMRALCEQVGAALEIPADLLLKAFDASYSASRAALLEAWKAFKMRREWFTSDFCRPIYEIWMSEAVAKGRISAPGFFTDPIIRAAWLGSEWIGPSQGQLDPVKEITAEILAIGEGITTREQATVKLNGGHWDSNIEELARENQRLSEASPNNQAAIGGQTQLKTSEIIRSVVNQAIKEGDNDGKHS